MSDTDTKMSSIEETKEETNDEDNENDENSRIEKLRDALSGQMVRIQSQDNIEIVVAREIIENVSDLVKEMLSDESKDKDEELFVPLFEIKGNLVRGVVDFCEKYYYDPYPELKKPIQSKNITELVPEWYANFIENFYNASSTRKEIIEFTKAAHFLLATPLLELCCLFFATKIKGQTPEEICAAFNIDYETVKKQNELTEENEQNEEK